MIKMYEVRDRKDGYWYSIDDMIKMYDDEPVNYSYVHKRLECPCCGEQILKCHIDKDDAYIESKRSKHKSTCDYYGFNLNQNKVKQRLNSGDDFTKEFHGIIHGHPETKKAVPRRGIERRLSEDDIHITKIFYGNVLIKPAYSKDETKYINFSVKAPKGDAITISFQQKCFAALKDEIEYLNSNIDKQIFILFIGSITEVGEYKNIVIRNKNQFCIKDLYLQK